MPESKKSFLENMLEFLENNHNFITIIHLFGVALGLGGATINDFLFFRFLKDNKISRWEARIMRMFHGVIWLAILILILSGFGIYLPEAEKLNNSPKFLIKMITDAVIIINGIFLNAIISPKLIYISFRKRRPHHPEFRYLTCFAFALGAISLTSWYWAFFLGMLRKTELAFSILLSLYVLFLITAVGFSQLAESYFRRRGKSKNND